MAKIFAYLRIYCTKFVNSNKAATAGHRLQSILHPISISTDEQSFQSTHISHTSFIRVITCVQTRKRCYSIIRDTATCHFLQMFFPFIRFNPTRFKAISTFPNILDISSKTFRCFVTINRIQCIKIIDRDIHRLHIANRTRLFITTSRREKHRHRNKHVQSKNILFHDDLH